MLFKDACNSKSNQKNLGTIKSSNLCTEIIEYTDPDEVTNAQRLSSHQDRAAIPLLRACMCILYFVRRMLHPLSTW